MSTITVKDGTTIYYEDWGEGPVVTLSPRMAAEFRCMGRADAFPRPEWFRVVAHDRRGHGRSSQASSGNNTNGYADDLASVIEELAI